MTELWDVYDGQARKTGRTMKRGTPKDGDYMLCAHVYIYTSEGKFLVQKRALSKELHPGEWDITVGAVLAGEESIAGAIRETKEEIGIDISEEDLYLAGRVKKQNKFIDIYFVKKDFDIACCELQEEEVADVKFIEVSELIDIEKNGRKRDEAYMDIIYDAIKKLGIAL